MTVIPGYWLIINVKIILSLGCPEGFPFPFVQAEIQAD